MNPTRASFWMLLFRQHKAVRDNYPEKNNKYDTVDSSGKDAAEPMCTF